MVRLWVHTGVVCSIFGSVLLSSAAWAGQQFVAEGAALSGYDAVAYQDDGKAVRGDASITADSNGATWRFTSAAHLAQFQANPALYAPAYDGHCAYAASEGRKSAGNPEMWQVAKSRLYLLCSKTAVEKWTTEFDARLARADANWATLEALPAAIPIPSPPTAQ